MTNKEIHAEVKHLRQTARCSYDNYIGRLTRQSLNRQADDLEKQLKPICTPIDFLSPSDRVRIENYQNENTKT